MSSHPSGMQAGYDRLPTPIVRERSPYATETRQATPLSAYILSHLTMSDAAVPIDTLLRGIEPRPTVEQLLNAYDVIVSDGSTLIESSRFKKRTATVERCLQLITPGMIDS